VAALVQRIDDRSGPDLDRGQAFAELEHVDYDTAARLAHSLLNEKGSLGFRAAWILAQTGDSQALKTLRLAAQDREDKLTLAIQALGRLRDPGSHQLLRDLLADELSRTGAAAVPYRGRTFSLILALSDYEDEGDAELLTRAVTGYSALDWVSVDRLGRTRGSSAVPFLREVFLKTGRGWAVMSAGLALARCGDARGIRYVEEQLASAEPAQPEAREPTNAMTDDPYGPQAKHFLMERLGARGDEIFVMQLLTIASDTEQPFRPRAIAWSALLRIHSPKYRTQVLQAAWNDASFDGASRLIALDDEANAREFSSRDSMEASKSQRLAASAIRAALAAPVWEKRRWCEPFGYGF
jgi:HEAT repeat protein